MHPIDSVARGIGCPLLCGEFPLEILGRVTHQGRYRKSMFSMVISKGLISNQIVPVQIKTFTDGIGIRLGCFTFPSFWILVPLVFVLYQFQRLPHVRHRGSFVLFRVELKTARLAWP